MDYFNEYFMSVIKNQYVDFTGRATRKQFWMFILFSVIISIILQIIDAILIAVANVAFLGALFSLAILLPTLAIGARRLHDTNKSGWMQLLQLIPLVGAIILIYLWIQPSDKGKNQYGEAVAPEAKEVKLEKVEKSEKASAEKAPAKKAPAKKAPAKADKE